MVWKNNKAGAVDIKNNIVIPFEYEDMHNFSKDGFAGAKKKGKWGVIDKNNRMTIPFEYEDIMFSILDTKDGFTAKKNGKWGKIDKNNKVIIPFTHDSWYGID